MHEVEYSLTLSRPRDNRRRAFSIVLVGNQIACSARVTSGLNYWLPAVICASFEVARTVIGRYGGVVEKFIGDAVMAVWGTPAATEGDAKRAVRAALDLVAAVADLGGEAGLPGMAARHSLFPPLHGRRYLGVRQQTAAVSAG